jgi:hypothetical protein
VPDPLQAVDPVGYSPFVSSGATVNAVLAAARDWRALRRGREGSPDGAGRPEVQPALTVWVRNDTGGSLPAFSVLALGEPVASPADEPYVARDRPVFPGTAPAGATDVFAVTTEPAKVGGLVRATVTGATPAYLSVSDEAHACAAPAAATTSTLASAANGPARVVWKESGTGAKWAIVLIGQAVGGGSGAAEPTDGSWVAGLTEDDCLTLTVTSAAGRCADIDTGQTMRLRYDYGTWVSAPDEDFVHDGGSGPVVFSVTATGGPKLTIGGLSGVSAGGTAAYHDFDFGGALLCDAAPASCEANTFRVRLTCLSCPIRPGYNPGPSAAYWDFAMSPGPYTADNGYGGLRGTPLVCNTLADLNKCDVFVYFVNLNGASGTSAGRNWSGASIDVDDLAAWITAGGRCIVVPYYDMFTGGGGSCGGTLSYVNGVLLCQDFITAYTRIDAELTALGSAVEASLTELTFPTTTFGCGAYWREACSGPCSVAPCGFESVPTAAVVANGAGNVYDPSVYGILTGNYYRSHFLNGTAVTLAPATYYDCPYTGPSATNVAPVMIEQVGSGYIMCVNYWTFRRNGNGSTCREFYKIARNFRDLAVPL